MASPEPDTPRTIADRLALALLAIAAVVALATFRDYGLGWDDYTHAEYGDLLLALYASGFTDRRALSLVNLYDIRRRLRPRWPRCSRRSCRSRVFETRRLIGAIVGMSGL